MIDREIDREKVAEALECYRMNLDHEHCEKKECPYNNNDPHYGYWCCSNSLLYDAVHLLKEAQEITEYISKKEAVSRISDLLMIKLKGKRLPTWNEVYHAIND